MVHYRRFVLVLMAILSCAEMRGQYRVAIEPSVEITQVHDDNLFFSAANPAADRVLRLRPGFDLRLESPRWSAAGAYAFDSERYADHSSLSNGRARQRGSLSVRYHVDPRLTIAVAGGYTDTNTPAELNILTGLAAARARVKHLDFSPSAVYRVSPRLSAHAAVTSTSEKYAGGSMRSMSELAGIEHRMTPRDTFTADCEHVRYLFGLATPTVANTYVLRGGWTHVLSPATRIVLQAGPRLTDRTIAPELSFYLNHDWQFSSASIGAVQTETTAIGSLVPIQARSLQAMFTYRPSRSLTAYATPAAVRSVYGSQNATVYRIGMGAHYAMTPLAGFDVTYTHDSQHGVVGAPGAPPSILHSMLSVGFTTRWTAPDFLGTGRR
jgi:hypothetical protein